MTKRLGILAVLVTATAYLSSCATPGKDTGIGAGAGAAGGAIIGAVAGGTRGAVMGGVAGALAGGAVGNYLDKQANELKKVADTKRTTDGILVKLKNDLLFDVDSAVLKPDAIEQLSQLGDVLAKYKEDRIKVEGYTDSTGKKTHNQSLSMQRAAAVKDVLIGRGVTQQQVTALGFGPENPVASNKTNTGRSANRRVELKIDVPNAKKSG